MDREYKLYYEESIVGKVSVNREGLYYCIQSEAKPSVSMRYWLALETGRASIIIGMCVPDGNIFRSYNRIAACKIPDGVYRFRLLTSKDNIIPIYEDQVFDYLEAVETGRLKIYEDMLYLNINPIP